MLYRRVLRAGSGGTRGVLQGSSGAVRRLGIFPAHSSHTYTRRRSICARCPAADGARNGVRTYVRATTLCSRRRQQRLRSGLDVRAALKDAEDNVAPDVGEHRRQRLDFSLRGHTHGPARRASIGPRGPREL